MLSKLGFDQFFQEQMETLDSGLTPARVVGQHRREWDVATEEGSERAVLAGRQWAQDHVVQLDDAQPAVGDWVALKKGDGDGVAPVIVQILKRKTELSRSSMARRGARQTLVANVDRVGVVAAFSRESAGENVSKRSLHARRIERYLAAVVAGGAKPIVVINKADLCTDPQTAAQELSRRLSGVDVVSVSTLTPSGLRDFERLIFPGQTVALVGLSGVGKSSIINQLLGKEAQKVSGERAHDGRGRHTTTHRELFFTPEGYCLIDTPGMREFALAEVSQSDLLAFSDITTWAEQCQFRDCGHKEEPGCAVVQAVARNELHPDRLEGYLELLVELAQLREQPTRRKLVKADRRRSTKRLKKGRLEDWDDE